MSKRRNSLSKSFATLLETKPRKIDDGIKIISRDTTLDENGEVRSISTVYTQFGMTCYDFISAPGIEVPKRWQS